MAKYKKTHSITMKEACYPNAVAAANAIAESENRNVHEIVEDVLVAEAEKRKVLPITQLADAG